MALRSTKHYTAYIQLGRSAEDEGDESKAVEMYELAIKQEPAEELPYTRLMIIYRRLKKPKEEIRVLDKALKVFKKRQDEKKEKLLGGNKKIEQTSKALLKFLAPKGSKLQPYYPQPVPKWIKRKEMIEKRMVKKK